MAPGKMLGGGLYCQYANSVQCQRILTQRPLVLAKKAKKKVMNIM